MNIYYVSVNRLRSRIVCALCDCPTERTLPMSVVIAQTYDLSIMTRGNSNDRYFVGYYIFIKPIFML